MAFLISSFPALLRCYRSELHLCARQYVYAHCVHPSRGREASRQSHIKPTKEAEKAWSMQVLMRAANFAAMSGCTPSYLNNEGATDRLPHEQQLKRTRGAIWGHGIADYVRVIKEWRQKGSLEGLDVAVAA